MRKQKYTIQDLADKTGKINNTIRNYIKCKWIPEPQGAYPKAWDAATFAICISLIKKIETKQGPLHYQEWLKRVEACQAAMEGKKCN